MLQRIKNLRGKRETIIAEEYAAENPAGKRNISQVVTKNIFARNQITLTCFSLIVENLPYRKKSTGNSLCGTAER